MKKLGLALGSGGARGVAHIGFLKALDDNGIKPYCISGSSMGSVVGACYAHGLTPEYMLNIALALKMRDIFDLSPSAIHSGTLLKSKKLSAILNKFLNYVTFDDLNMPFSCVGTDLISGKKVIFSQGDVATAVQASSSIPLVFAPVEYDNFLVADGGVLCRLPIEETRNLGADVVVAVDVLGPLSDMDEIKSIMKYLFRIIDIADCNTTRLNGERFPADIYVTPDLGDMSQYKIDREKIKMSYEEGYKSALSIMEELKFRLK